MEQRKGIRIPFDLFVAIDGKKALNAHGSVVNASRSGLLVRTRKPMPEFSRVKLKFVNVTGEQLPLAPLDVTAVRSEHGTVAFAWDDPDLVDMAMLMNLEPSGH